MTDANGDADEGLSASIFQQMIDIWVRPEIARRRAAGTLGDGFVLTAAQLICSADGAPNVVRLNGEVQALAFIRLKPGVTKRPGEDVFLHESDGIGEIKLPETEDPNCGHATLVRFGDGWHVSFDFRYNRGRAVALLARARQFLTAATLASEAEAWSVLAYNLFTAMELAAKAELLVMANMDLLQSKTHAPIRSRLNHSAKLGNVDLAHASTFNELADLRHAAAYSFEPFHLPDGRASALLASVTEFIEVVAVRAGPRQTVT